MRKVQSSALILMLGMTMILAPATEFPSIRNWDSLVMRLERTTCFGTCPDYTIEIHGDGTVLYEGRAFVAITGKHRGRISQTSVKAIFEAFQKTDYFALRRRYFYPVTDNPTKTTSIAFDGHHKQVVDYVGQQAGMPEAVTQLERIIDDLSNSERWTKGNADTYRTLAEENWDFTSAEAAASLTRIAYWGSAAAVRDFVAAGTRVDLRDGSLGNSGTAFDFAAQRGDVEMLRALLGGAPKASREILTSALSAAAAAGHLETMKILVESGGDPAASGELPPLVAAAKSGIPAVVNEILKYHPDLAARDKDGRTALISAVNRECCGEEPKDADRRQVVRSLLAAGANVNARDSRGNTALIENAWDPEIATVLLQHGADINAQRNDGWTPLFSASSPELATFLLEHGADIRVRDKEGETALESKRHLGDREVVRLLEAAEAGRKH